MGNGKEPRIYEVEVEYLDAGFQLAFRGEDIREMVQEDFTSFEVIRETFRTDMEDVKQRLRDEWRPVEEIDEEDLDPEQPSLRIKNPPEEWIEDPAEAAEFYDMANTFLARMGLAALTESEIDSLEELLDDSKYKAALVRESAYIEEYLSFMAQLELQNQKGGVLSNNELSVIENIGHRDRIRFAHLIGVISEVEHGLLQEMANWRNEITHTAWTDFDRDEESQIRSTAERVLEFLKEQLEREPEYPQGPQEIQSTEEFLGFEALDIEYQLLQISIFTVLESLGDSASLAEIQSHLTNDPDEVEKRIKTMRSIGYIEKNGEEYHITDQGHEFIKEEIP